MLDMTHLNVLLASRKDILSSQHCMRAEDSVHELSVRTQIKDSCMVLLSDCEPGNLPHSQERLVWALV